MFLARAKNRRVGVSVDADAGCATETPATTGDCDDGNGGRVGCHLATVRHSSPGSDGKPVRG